MSHHHPPSSPARQPLGTADKTVIEPLAGETISPADTAKAMPLATIDIAPPGGTQPAGPGATIDMEPGATDAAGPGATLDLPGGSATVAATVLTPAATGDSSLNQERVARPAAPLPAVEGYQILAELGRGGMGVVYKARQKKLNRVVALKMVLAGAHAGPEQLARFYTEAEAVAHLQQPNIVQIYEVGEHEGLPYFSLEYVNGGCLADRIGGKPQPVEDAARMVEQLSRAMAYAHELGIIHRDLKPANVLLTKDGQPKITDFGLAKRLESDASQTRSGTLMGTPNYMAPEQARGEVHEVGPLADVYALGVILYEMLVGRTPFLGTSILDTLQQVRNQEPVPPSRLQPKVPRDLETICLKCLEKEPAKRYATAGLLADDLKRFLAGEPIQARPVGRAERAWRWCRRNPRVAALSAAVLLLVLSLAIGGPLAAVLVAQQKSIAERNAYLASLARDEAKRNEQEAVAARIEADKNAKLAAEQRGLALEALGALVTKVQEQLKETPATQKLKQDLLLSALDGLRNVARSAQGSQRADRMMAEAYQRMGDIFQGLGQLTDARQQYQEAHRMIEALGDDEPDPVQWQRKLAFSFGKLGNASFLLGDHEAARAYYLEALKLRENLASAAPGDAPLKTDLATSYVMLAVISPPEEAEPLFTKALRIRKELATGKAPIRRHRDVWIVYNQLGELARKRGDAAEAREYFDQALTLARRLAGAAKGPQPKSDLAVSYVNAGNVRQAAGEWDAARDLFATAVELLRPLAKDDPENIDVQANFVLALARAGQHQEAAAKAEELRSLAPDNFRNLYNVACTYSLCAVALRGGKEERELPKADRELASSYVKQALDTLQAALAAGFKDFDLLRSDPDLLPLRSRAEWQTIAAAGN